MQRTAGRSAFALPMTSTFHLKPRAPSPVVADLRLVRSMTRMVIFLLLLASVVAADTTKNYRVLKSAHIFANRGHSP